MPNEKLTKFLLLPELELVDFKRNKQKAFEFHCKTKSEVAYCPHCGLETSRVHDRRVVTIKDAPHGNRPKVLIITKKRFRCAGQGCHKVFTEVVPGISKHAKLTERFQRHILYACDNYANLKGVRKDTRVGNKTIYTRHYKQLELEWRKRKNDPWPKTIGIDEHSFGRNKQFGNREFATIVVDHNNKRVRELIPGRNIAQLHASLDYIPGRKNVKNVTMDLSTTYRSFARDFFPNAKIIADKFHVIRLLNTSLNKYRKQITGHKKGMRLRKLLLMDSKKLDHWTKRKLEQWLVDYPKLAEVYYAKEALFKLYRCKGFKWARKVLTKITDTIALSKVPELKTFRRTLMNWSEEILNYFENRLTNARTEGFNTVCKQLQKRAYGYKSFVNYRLRVLYACV